MTRIDLTVPVTGSDLPRLFQLVRHTDDTGVSDPGHVADGVLWPDGIVTVHWHRHSSLLTSLSCWINLTEAKRHIKDAQIMWLDGNTADYRAVAELELHAATLNAWANKPDQHVSREAALRGAAKAAERRAAELRNQMTGGER
jgi:hypothetical protein